MTKRCIPNNAIFYYEMIGRNWSFDNYFSYCTLGGVLYNGFKTAQFNLFFVILYLNEQGYK